MARPTFEAGGLGPQLSAGLEVDVARKFGDFALAPKFHARGGVTALFGPSGAGKSRTIELIAGLARPTRGRIALDGEALFDAEARINLAPERRRLGVVFQDARLFPHMSVARNLGYGAPRGREGRFDEIVALLGLEALLARRPHHLSGGERQRVAIGRALLSAPRLLLMDEPLSGLDRQRRAEVMPFIERLRDEAEVSILYVSHNVEEVIRLADEIAVIEGGRVAAAGPLETTLSRALRQSPELHGARGAGVVLSARVARHDEAAGLTALELAGGDRLLTSRLPAPVGRRLRVRLRARAISLAIQRPEAISILNRLEGRVVEVVAPEDQPEVDVRVRLTGGAEIWARLTRHSARELNLEARPKVWALVKSVAVAAGLPGHEPLDELLDHLQ